MAINLLCLHGWGGSSESFEPLRTALKGTDITLHTPDLPGFGDAPEPDCAWTVDDYANWVEKYAAEHLNGQPFLLLGHSNGGRIAIKLAHRQSLPVTHLYLCAAAGIRHPRHIKRIIGLTLAKGGKALFSIPGISHLQPVARKLLYKLVRVHDYEKASPIMQQTLIEVSKEDLRPLLRTVTYPTDIFWGKQDGMTPYNDALIMNREIPHSTLHSFDEVRHGVHKDKAADIAAIISGQLSSAGAAT